MITLPFHYQETLLVPVSPLDLFNYVDDHKNLSSHMNKSSLMMGGGKMETILDAGKGQKTGSHIRLSGKAFGLEINIDEVVTKRNPPLSKEWETVGTPKLLIIGNYRLGFSIIPTDAISNLTVFIDYELPRGKKLLGVLFGKIYAKWCVHQMIRTAQKHY